MTVTPLLGLRARDPLGIVIAGTAGQGAVFSATLMAKAAAMTGRYVAQTARSSAAVRSGRSTAHIIISGAPIDFPFVTEPDVLVLLSDVPIPKGLRLDKTVTLVCETPHRTTAALNPKHTISIPEVPLPEDIGIDATNMAMVGVLSRAAAVIPPDAVLDLISKTTAPATAKWDIHAFNHGARAADSILERRR